MAKVLKAVFGIGIAVIVYIVVLLGIDAFYPEVDYEDFCNESLRYADPVFEFAKCPDNITVGECRSSLDFTSEERVECDKAFSLTSKEYNQRFFIIASVLGTIVLIVAYFLLSVTNISTGVASAGIVLIVWAFMRGWESTNSLTKFVVALVIAVVIVSLTVVVNKKLGRG